MPKVITDKNELYTLNENERGNITHLYLAFNDLHSHFLQQRKVQEFLSALVECTSLQYVNIQYNSLSLDEVESITGSFPRKDTIVHWESESEGSESLDKFTPIHAYHLLIVARHWQQKYPHIKKFHRANKQSTKVKNHSREIIVNSPYSILILPNTEPVILLRTYMLPHKFTEYKRTHVDNSIVPFAQYEPNKEPASLKIGAMLQHSNTAGCAVKKVIIKTAFSTQESNSFKREAVFSANAGLFIGLQRRDRWHEHTFAKDYFLTPLEGAEDAHEWLNQNVNQKHSTMLPHIIYSIAMILEVMSAHILGVALFDVKPENFILKGDNAKFIDYGSAQEFSSTPIKLTSDTKTSSRYASKELLHACNYRTEIMANAQPDHHALAIVLREFLHPFSMSLNKKWYFHKEEIKHIDDALEEHFFTGIQQSISNPDIAILLHKYTTEYPKHNFLNFVKLFFSEFPQLTKHVVAVRTRSTIRTILQHRPSVHLVLDFLNSNGYLNANFMEAKFNEESQEADIITASINWMCKLHITATHLTVYGESTSLESIQELWKTPTKDICELDKPYETTEYVYTCLRERLRL